MYSIDSVILWIFVVPMLITVLIVVAARRFDAHQIGTLRRDGRTIRALVTRLGADAGDGMTSPTYWADVACPGDAFIKRVTVRYDQYKTLQTGSRVDVTYLPGRPSSARILG